MILTERLYLAADGVTVVKEGDLRAAFLLGGVGAVIPDAKAKKLGLLPEPEKVLAKVIEPTVVTREPVVEHRDPEVQVAPRRRGRPPKLS